ncbi:MAG TPA: chromosomal replication initiator protein DnaA [Ktedonobacterales bacterium]
MSGGHVWRAALDQLRREMSRAQFDTWLNGTQLTLAGEGAAAVLRVRSTFARELLETRYRERIQAAIAQVTGRACALRVVVGQGEAEDDASGAESDVADALDPEPALAAAPAAGQPAQRTHGGASHAARARYDGPTLFGATADDGTPPQSRRAVSQPIPRRRAGGSTRGTSTTVRVRGALGRANGAMPATAHAAEDDAADDAPPTPPAAAVVTHAPAAPAPRHVTDERDEMRPMNEQGEPQGGAGGMPLPRLNARYRFSTFIVGSGNRLAHAASLAVSDAPGQAYNPLFLYGGVGLGKTHLLHALGHKMLELGLTVLYVSSETFTNEIINAIRFRTTDEFRAKYRSVDVLLVDDIQFIAGKDSTEEEFFHTFNSLYEMSKQIVICSDRPPKAIISLEERLRSRFEWGLIADIQPPDLETRMAILRAKADQLGREVPDDVMAYVAGRVQSNIRELEGSFNRLLAYADLQGLPLSMETAKAALASIASDGRQRRVSVAEVLAAVAEYYRIPEDDLRGKQRDKHIVVPRQVAMYLMRQETEASLLEIGQALGGRDHSTVLHGFDKITRAVNENTSLRKEVLAIRQQLLD